MNTLQIRKKWLRAFIWYLSIGTLSFLLILLFGEGQEKLYAGIYVPRNLIWGWITYHCAYQKNGTAWLMFLLIVLPLGMLKSLTLDLQDLGSGTPLDIFIDLGLAFFLIIIYFWFWLNCLRLRELNLTLKNNPLPNSAENM